MLKLPSLAPTPLVQIDWRSYFYEFCKVHGNSPVPHPYDPTGAKPPTRLLFEDGWTYSSTDYRGPEYPPPEDPRDLRELLTTYWRVRYAILNNECTRLKNTILGLQTLQSTKSAPLQQISKHLDPDTGGVVQERMTVDFQGLQEQLELTEADLENAEQKLRELGE